jgi:hypothetical protein
MSAMTWRGFDYLDEVLVSRGPPVGVLGVIRPALLRPVRQWLPDDSGIGQAGARDSPKHDRERDHEHDRPSASPTTAAQIRAGLAPAAVGRCDDEWNAHS